ncbi:hypothetical protein NP233_g2996 [Leucocoprinus birnbaumii]|uniref:Uncharacterized protein n=1 Tax=Leucocoprinus birnbaumii TaxID=56174 RepID=A0AAD5VXC1_9AGAR|nr:hypothetical protein NP233_g2996 [Leucocoprinus birnbaumii]
MNDAQKNDFTKHILSHHVPQNSPPRKIEKLFDAFLTWVGQATSENPISRELEATIIYVNRKAVVKEALLSEIPVYHVTSLPGSTVSTSADPDTRIPRKHIEILDTAQLRFDLPPDQSSIFRDSVTNEIIAVVIRDACTNADAVAFVDDAVEKAIQTRVTIRKEDAGTLALMGYSLGARSARNFDWVRNVIRKTIPTSPRTQESPPKAPEARVATRRSARLAASAS